MALNISNTDAKKLAEAVTEALRDHLETLKRRTDFL